MHIAAVIVIKYIYSYTCTCDYDRIHCMQACITRNIMGIIKISSYS